MTAVLEFKNKPTSTSGLDPTLWGWTNGMINDLFFSNQAAGWNTFFLMEADVNLIELQLDKALMEETAFVWIQNEPFFSLTSSNILISFLRIIFVLIGVAYFTLAERKIMASIQRRRGPNVVGLFGLLQPLADGLKLLCKEMVVPTKANSLVFLVAPVLIIILSLVGWLVIPFSAAPVLSTVTQVPASFHLPILSQEIALTNFWSPIRNFYYPIADLNLSVLFLLAISSLNVYGIIIAGWASNSKYAFLGSLRSAAQMISYEVSIGLTILPVILLAGSSNLTEIVLAQERTVWFVAPLLPSALIFFVSMLAETNRAPFDLPEAEAELVAGYNVEYSSIIFAMFFLGEYSNMLLMSAISVVLFWGGWLPAFQFISFFVSDQLWMAFKIVIVCFLFVLVRATFPRYRYDQLMNIGWKVFLPVTLAFFVFCAGLLYYMEAAPVFKEIDLI
jgi:NADH-quinone oxidoreductase subunit H